MPITMRTKLSRQDDGEKLNSTLYKRFVGNIMYLNTGRPNIKYENYYISIFMEFPKESY